MTKPLHFAIAGPKGADYLRNMLDRNVRPDRVYSYSQKNDASNSYSSIAHQCEENSIELLKGAHFEPAPEALIIFVGWQYMVEGAEDNLVVFHDSLLPRHRGYNPTVSALIADDRDIGVTAFRPDGGVDTGPIIVQASASIPQFCRIADALSLQVSLMVELSEQIVARWRSGSGIVLTPQTDEDASYSLWRDEDDYRIDFADSAEQILRHIRAVAWPYAGALARMGSEEVRIFDAEILPDLSFTNRTAGKVWALSDGQPIVVCGEGLLRILDMRDLDGEEVKLTKLRTRFS